MKLSFLGCILLQGISVFAHTDKELREKFPHFNDYERVEIMDQNFQGWYPNASFMEHLITYFKPKIIIELGAWRGISALHMANLLPSDGRLFTVDHWYMPPHNKRIPYYYRNFDIKNLYRQFLSNVIHCQMQHKIIPVVATTDEACLQFKKHKIVPDLIYIDADHEEESVYNDLKNYFPLVKGHGVICGDNYGWNLTSVFPVKRSVERFAKENNLKVNTPNNWFWYLSE